MLVEATARSFGDSVRVVQEDFGASPLAERFGVKRYPAVFVDDLLIAKPKDFGFYGTSGSQGTGRYTPWLDPASHAAFQRDLEREIRRTLRGGDPASRQDPTRSVGEVTLVADELQSLPDLKLEDVYGQALSADVLRETVTIVEFWATWCPPCMRTLPFLSELQERHPEDLQVVGVAVESRAEDVLELVEEQALAFPVVQGNAELSRSFGDILSVPTLFLFAQGGELVKVIHGAPPDLHADLEEELGRLLSRPASGIDPGRSR